MKKLFFVIGILIFGIPALKVQPIDTTKTTPDTEQRTIWIDTDIAIGRFGKDVDDAIALIIASRNITSFNKVDYCDKVRPKLKEVIMNLLLDRQSKEVAKWH